MKSTATNTQSLLLRRWLPLLALLFPALAQAAEPSAANAESTASGLQIIDWIIIAAYAGTTIFLGWWFGRKQKNTKEYFVGSGNMNPMLIGVSLFATLLSTISYLSFPGETLGKGPIYMTNLLAYPLIFYIVGYKLLPIYMAQKVTSAYELLEMKLGLSVRLLGAGLFLVLRLFWMSLLIYVTAKAIAIMMFEGKHKPIQFTITSGVTATAAGYSPQMGEISNAAITEDGQSTTVQSLAYHTADAALTLELDQPLTEGFLNPQTQDHSLVIRVKEPTRVTTDLKFSEGAIAPDGRALVWSLDENPFGESPTSAAYVEVKRNYDKYIPWIVLITGFIAIVYTSLGGLRAVVITDLMQTILLYGGAVLVLGIITWKMGGIGWFPTEWQADIWDKQPVFSLDPSVRVTVVGSILSVLIWYTATSGGDQVSVQRFMATKDAATAKRAIGMQLTVGAVVGVTLGLVGFALLGYFQANPGEIPPGMTLNDDADKIFPHFIAHGLPSIVSGLVLAGLFAAAMSSVDSGVNSITAVVMTDFLDRFGKKPKTERQQMIFARGLAFGVGAIVVLCSSLVEQVPGNITAVTGKTVNLLTVPIFLLFFFALFAPSANTKGAWAGVVSSATIAILISFSGPLFGMNPETGLDPISFQWIGPFALAVGMSVGLASSRFFNLNTSATGALLFSALAAAVAYKVLSLEIKPIPFAGSLITGSWIFLFITPKPSAAKSDTAE
ncbi:MAG: Na+/proline symporter [Candidatus Binatia bacterium]|jgi:Na+/proline symporter